MTKAQALRKARATLAANRALKKSDEKMFQELKQKFEETKSFMLEQCQDKEALAKKLIEEALTIRKGIILMTEQLSK